MTPEERGEKAAQLKKSGACNCCQAVLRAFADVLDAGEATLDRFGAGFTVGMGTMEATCGALVGAGMVAGLHEPDRRAAMRLSADILSRFRAKTGATLCKDLKGRDTGRVLCECPECCCNAVLAAEETLAGCGE